jgi:phosphoserine phosphatase RsbU/P
MANVQSVEALLARSDPRISDQLQLLADMGQDFAASMDIEDTLGKALDRITKYMNAAGGALFMLDPGGETITCRACVGATDITGLTLKSDQGIVGRCVQNNAGEIVRDVTQDPNWAKQVDEETGFITKSILCATMSVKDQSIGAIEMVNKLGGDELFSEADLYMLQSLASSAALAVLNARMASAMVDQERVRRELELAAEIQRSLLPPTPEEGSQVFGINLPARMVSGDFYDFFALADGRICFNLGDVSGKGMNAALLMAKTASLFHCLGKTIHNPGDLLAQINAEICETVTRGMFVTMLAGIYDPKTGIARIANAGHEPPLLLRLDGTFVDFPADAPPLGIVALPADSGMFPEVEVDLAGGTFYVFTDGVTEGYLTNGDMLGAEGLMALIRETGHLPLAGRLAAIVERFDRGDAGLRDDLTILAVEDRR